MIVVATKLKDCVIIEPEVFRDERGFFLETFQSIKYDDLAGITLPFVQDNYSRSSKGVLRGLHFQKTKPQGKLVGILYPINKDINDGGPPFGVDLGLTINLFSKYFTLYTKEFPTLSIEHRNGQEIFVIFKKI